MVDFLSKDYIYVNSLERSSGSTNDFYINLSAQIRTPNDYNNIVLLSASIPKSYYLINSLNNVFQIQENTGTRNITIPIGNYSFSQMTTTLNYLATVSGLSYVYNCVASAQTGKFTFTQSTGALPSSFIFGSNSPYHILGFNTATYAFTGIFGAYTLSSINCVNFQLTNNIQVMCDVVDKSLLAVIIPDESDFATILYQEQNAAFSSKNFIANNTHSFHFWLLDGQSGLPLNLNGIDVQFTFVCYKRNNYFNLRILDDQLKLIEENLNK